MKSVKEPILLSLFRSVVSVFFGGSLAICQNAVSPQRKKNMKTNVMIKTLKPEASAAMKFAPPTILSPPESSGDPWETMLAQTSRGKPSFSSCMTMEVPVARSTFDRVGSVTVIVTGMVKFPNFPVKSPL